MTSSFRQPLTGVRTQPGTFVKGIYVVGTTSAISFDASVQPLSSEEQETLPEGFREKSAYKLYTDFKLNAVNEGTKEPGDKVNIYNNDYLVIVVNIWGNNVINHFKAIAVELNG